MTFSNNAIMDQKNYRRLILLYIALGIAGVAAAFMPGIYSQALSDAYENEPIPSFLESVGFTLAVMLPFLVSAALGVYGLYMFKPWGRVVSVASTVAALIILPFSGPSLYGALESALWELSSLVWGAILALSYFSPIALKFVADKPVPAAHEDVRA